MSKIEVGKEYDVDHMRKGKFRIKADKVSGSLITGTITKGEAKYMSEPNRVLGDVIILDTSRSFITLTSVGE